MEGKRAWMAGRTEESWVVRNEVRVSSGEVVSMKEGSMEGFKDCGRDSLRLGIGAWDWWEEPERRGWSSMAVLGEELVEGGGMGAW